MTAGLRRVLVLGLILAGRAHAAPPDPWSASRDAPVLEYAYGPRAQLSVGHAVTIFEAGRSRLALSALVALENADSHSPLPDELARLVVDLGYQVSIDRWGRALGADGAFALGVGLGLERARELRSTDEVLLPDPRPGDIPFGGGGDWIALEAAARVGLGRGLTLSLRLRERVYWNALPLLVGDRAAADVVADFLGEALAQSPSLGATLSWQASPRLTPVLALFGQALLPHDQSAHASGFARALVGLGVGRALFFLSFDAGSGEGMLINRHELRFSLGVRHAL